MVAHSIRALGVSGLRINNPNPRQRTPQLLLDAGEGIAWHLVRDLHPIEAGPRPIMDTLCLSPSGQTLLGLIPDDPDPTADARRQAQRLVLIDVATGRQRMTPFVQQGRDQQLQYGLAPNEQDLAVAFMQWTGETACVTLTVLRGPDLVVSAERVFDNTIMAHSLQDTQMQWSPDGRLLALSIRQVAEIRESVMILDTGTLETVLQVDPLRETGLMQLAGAASWSPDSRQLAICWQDHQRILHLADGRQEKPEWLKGPRGDPPRQPLILGLLPGNRALIQRQNGTRLRLSGVDLATGKGPVLADLLVAENDEYLQMAVSREWENVTPIPRRRKNSRSTAAS